MDGSWRAGIVPSKYMTVFMVARLREKRDRSTMNASGDAASYTHSNHGRRFEPAGARERPFHPAVRLRRPSPTFCMRRRSRSAGTWSYSARMICTVWSRVCRL